MDQGELLQLAWLLINARVERRYPGFGEEIASKWVLGFCRRLKGPTSTKANRTLGKFAEQLLQMKLPRCIVREVLRRAGKDRAKSMPSVGDSIVDVAHHREQDPGFKDQFDWLHDWLASLKGDHQRV